MQKRKSINKKTKEIVFDKTDGRCHVCGKTLFFNAKAGSRERWRVDHILQKSRGGEDLINNYLPICRDCNFLRRNYGSLEGKRILELGCGIGRFTRELALRASNVTAVDMTLGMLERAKDYTADITNITYINSRITDLDALPEFDIVFETITLLHILDEKEYRKSLEIMKSAAPYIFICEHMADSAPVSPYSKLRTFEQYEQDFKPFKLIAYDKNHYCAGDWFPMMLFKK